MWRGRISEAARSGLSIREFCRQRHLKESQFYWWQRQLKERRPMGARNQAGAEPRAGFALVAEEAGTVDAGLELVLGDGRRLRIGRGVDEATLRAVLAAVESRAC
jgi:hypothetical protein